MDELAHAISKHKDLMSVFECAQAMDVKDTYILGPLLIVQHLFSALGIDEVLKRLVAKHPKLEFDFLQVIFTLVVCRFIRPGSKLKVFEHWQDKLYPKLLSGKSDLHHYYRALDLLCGHKEDIEQGLFWHQRDLLNSAIDVVLYDLTTLRFESTREDLGQLRRFGYSKERRSDCTQVVLGLLVDPEGIPLGFEVYPGNTFEGSTLKDIVKRMRDKFRVRRFIFVADRGLFSRNNLMHIRQECGEAASKPGEFIVGMKLAVFKKRAEEFYDRTRFIAINDELAIYETEHEGDRCIITWSKKDGYFGVVSNVTTMKAQEIVSAYKNLWIVEDAFGEIKGSLKARPIFHWTDERIIGHLTLCFMAYYCEAQMTKVLRNKGIQLETFVDPERYQGTIYRASNWLLVGSTQGYRRIQGGYSEQTASRKLVFIPPLQRNARSLLSRPVLPDRYQTGTEEADFIQAGRGEHRRIETRKIWTGHGSENITRPRQFAIGLLKKRQQKETMPEMMKKLLLNTWTVFDYLKMTILTRDQ